MQIITIYRDSLIKTRDEYLKIVYVLDNNNDDDDIMMLTMKMVIVMMITAMS